MEEAFECDGVRGALHRPDDPSGDALILTHGAGSNSQAPLLASVARLFAGAGCLTLRYDLPFRRMRPQGPPSAAHAARDREGIARAAAAVRRLAPGRVFAGGHSYGGRQTAMLAAESPGLAAGLLLLSYPLHPPSQPLRKRTAFFPELRTPVLFVHGTADPFGSLEELREAMASIPAPTGLLPVEGAGHDLKRGLDPSAILERFRALVWYPGN
jgi:predicted alpha/beta-hydrolase family hydrolase